MHPQAPVVRAPLADGGMWLARPDGYVAAVAGEANPAAIADCLNRLAGK
jgi:hypothetical protein